MRKGNMQKLLHGFLVIFAGVSLMLGSHFLATAGGPQSIKLPLAMERSLSFKVFESFSPDTGGLLQQEVIPGGESIGVLIQSEGVTVVGISDILGQFGQKTNPAVDAGIKTGDIILKIDGIPVKGEEEVREIVARAGAAGRPLTVEYRRGQEVGTAKVLPAYCSETMRYRIGLFIKDGAAGVGTMTFYEPKSRIFGALGHLITDGETARPVEISNGRIIGATVQGIHRGRRGQPGEKIGMLSNDGKITGIIKSNTSLGIYGFLQKEPESKTGKALPVAAADQVHVGAAEIFTVLSGDKVEKFTVEITRVNPNARDGKGMVIKVNDPRLIEETGGIIQGMSGSPVIQDGKLAGAVTHVFVNDPARGYGVLAEWMIREALNINEETGLLKKAGFFSVLKIPTKPIKIYFCHF